VWLGQQLVNAQKTSYEPPYIINSSPEQYKYILYDLHVYTEARLGREWTTVSGRLGIHAGDLGHYSYLRGYYAEDGNNFIPEAMLALGNPRIVYAQADAGYGAENVLGAYTYRFALGSGLGRHTGSNILLGYANSTHVPTPHLAFASANLRLPAGLSAVSLEPYFATDFDRHNIFSMKLHYQFGGK
jgi:hypothetical protein